VVSIASVRLLKPAPMASIFSMVCSLSEQQYLEAYQQSRIGFGPTFASEKLTKREHLHVTDKLKKIVVKTRSGRLTTQGRLKAAFG